MVDAAILALGVVAICSVWLDVFYAIAPQPTRPGLSWNRAISRVAWPLWLWCAGHIPNRVLRHGALRAFAPAFLIFFLLFWLTMLIVGYGCVFFALREHLQPVPSFGSAVYFAGITLLTIGYGDILPTDAAARAVSIAAGVTGVGLFSLTTAFLFSIFTSFRHREHFVILCGIRSSRPSSGLALVEKYARIGRLAELSALLSGSESWISAVIESHIAYPALIFFRTSDPELSWVATLVSLLDAAALLATAVRGVDKTAPEFVVDLGRYATRALSRHFDVSRRQNPMPRATFDRGFAALAAAGAQMNDADEAWDRFSEVRASYIHPLETIGRYLSTHYGEWFEEPTISAK